MLSAEEVVRARCRLQASTKRRQGAEASGGAKPDTYLL